ncbi:MAG: OpgC domain-containing protein [Pseudomonadota bacterium]
MNEPAKQTPRTGAPAQTSSPKRAAAPPRGPRDARLDFFRGLSLNIIFMAHVLGNSWNNWIPARFGLTDAADTFVFCSGFASGLAFYRVFQSHGPALGTLRVGYRVWEVYWAHILMTLASAMFGLALAAMIPGSPILGQFGLSSFIDNFERAAGLLFTLEAQPGRSDILPMYLVMLIAMPAVVLLARIHPLVPVAACLALYAYVQATDANLQHAAGGWFFNPLAWQVYFFGGFFIASGILPAPPRNWMLTAAAIGFVLFSILISHFGLRNLGDWAAELRADLIPRDHKTNLAPLRVLHFFCTAYLVGVAWKSLNDHLQAAWARPIVLMGQYALAIFMVGVLMSMLGTAIANEWRGGWEMWLAINLGGVAGLYLTAWIARESRSLARRSAPLPA